MTQPTTLHVQESCNILEILLDEKNRDLIDLNDHLGNEHTFRQIATIPVDDEVYCILKPLTNIGLKVGEAVVFKLVELEKGVHLLTSEEDEKKSLEIFLVYYEMLSSAVKKSEANDEEKALRLDAINSVVEEYRSLIALADAQTEA